MNEPTFKTELRRLLTAIMLPLIGSLAVYWTVRYQGLQKSLADGIQKREQLKSASLKAEQSAGKLQKKLDELRAQAELLAAAGAEPHSKGGTTALQVQPGATAGESTRLVITPSLRHAVDPSDDNANKLPANQTGQILALIEQSHVHCRQSISKSSTASGKAAKGTPGAASASMDAGDIDQHIDFHLSGRFADVTRAVNRMTESMPDVTLLSLTMEAPSIQESETSDPERSWIMQVAVPGGSHVH
ncbi:MAG: hypothetical protein U0892_21020 [Pirellulales bacterium]